MVDNYDLVLLVFVVEQLRKVLVLLYTRTRKTQSLTNVVFFIIVRITEVNQQEISLNTHRQLLCLDGDRSKIRCLTNSILLRLVPIINRLALLLLVEQFPQSRRLNPSEEFPLLFRHLLIT